MNSNPRPLVFFTAIFTLLTSGARADLLFDNLIQKVPFQPGASSVEGTFSFKNISAKPVTVIQLVSSCGCTVATLDEKVYTPGAVGQIKAVFTPGERVGRQSKTIALETDEAPGKAYVLTLECEVPNLVSSDATVLYWRAAAEKTTQSINITFTKPDTIKLIEAKSDTDDFVVDVANQNSAGLQLRVTPATTSGPTSSQLRLRFESKGGMRVDRTVALRVLPELTSFEEIVAPKPRIK